MGYIEQTDIGNVYVTDINDWFASLSNLNRECKNYTDSEIRYKEILAEHDKQIRAEAIYETIQIADCSHTDCWDCAFGEADICKLEQLYGQLKEQK